MDVNPVDVADVVSGLVLGIAGVVAIIRKIVGWFKKKPKN